MIDMNKKYQTRDGKEVRLYAVDGGGLWCVHGAISRESGWECRRWRIDGRTEADRDMPDDFIEVKASAIDKMIAYLEVHAATHAHLPFDRPKSASYDAIYDALTEARRIKAEME